MEMLKNRIPGAGKSSAQLILAVFIRLSVRKRGIVGGLMFGYGSGYTAHANFQRGFPLDSPNPVGSKLVEEYVDLLHARIAEKANDVIMALHFPSPFNAEFLQTVEEFGVSHQIGGLQVGQTCPFNEIKVGVTMAVNIDSFFTHKQFPSFS
jgi:hypothetical protein